MPATPNDIVGTVATIWRYPIKSMQGEEVNAAAVVETGLLGDRSRALVDQASGKIVSAKNPRKWPALFQYRARHETPPQPGAALPVICIEMPDGTVIRSDDPDVDEILSRQLGHDVSIETELRSEPVLDELWPDLDAFENANTVTEEVIKPGSFFDGASVHLLTTATLQRFRESYPEGRFEAKRFRPNLVVQCPPGNKGFVENGWIGHTVGIGAEVQLEISRPCPRCVMTTLPVGDLPKDIGILRTSVSENDGNAGVFVAVKQTGMIRCGDELRIIT